MNDYPLSAEFNYPLSSDFQVIGKFGDYWLENGQVKYKTTELKDCAPPGSLYTNYELVVTVKVVVDPPESLTQRLIAKKIAKDT